MIRIDKTSQQAAILLGAVSLFVTAGCSTKNYVRSQTTPLVQKTNELDDATAANNRSIQSTNDRAQAGIQQAQQSANTATQNATAATQAATRRRAARRRRSIVPTRWPAWSPTSTTTSRSAMSR
jgi:hypothetical protein